MRGIKLPRYVVPASAFCTLVGTTVLIRDSVRGRKYKGETRLAGRTVIITGANDGIGKATAMEMAKRGAKVIMACRNLAKAEKAKEEIIEETFNRNVHVRQLDLASMESIRKFAESVRTEEPRLDILINNAGIMNCPKSLTRDGFEMQLGVNHLGHFLLTNLLLDKLKSSSPSRIVVLASVAHCGGRINFSDLNSATSYNATEAYQQSKLANMLFCRELSKRLEGTEVSVFAVHPGVVQTNIGRHSGVLRSLSTGMILTPLNWLLMRSPEQGAQTVIYCAVEPSLEPETGKYYSDLVAKDAAEQAKDDKTAARLWAISEKWTGLS